eukprot:1915062-Heterocapsa_arctica.AAC.1
MLIVEPLTLPWSLAQELDARSVARNGKSSKTSVRPAGHTRPCAPTDRTLLPHLETPLSYTLPPHSVAPHNTY